MAMLSFLNALSLIGFIPRVLNILSSTLQAEQIQF